MKIMATSLKRSHECTATLSVSNPAAGHRRPTPPPETPGHLQASLGQSFVGSLLLTPGSWYTQGFVCALQESVSQSCVSSGGSMVGLMATSSKRKNHRSNCQHLLDHQKKQESSSKTPTSALLAMPKPLTVWTTTNYGNS